MVERILVGVEEAAKMLSISPRMVHLLVHKGELPSVKIGNRRLFRPESLKEWVSEREKREIRNEEKHGRPSSRSV